MIVINSFLVMAVVVGMAPKGNKDPTAKPNDKATPQANAAPSNGTKRLSDEGPLNTRSDKQFLGVAEHQVKHGNTVELRQDAGNALAEYKSAPNYEAKGRVLKQFRLDKSMKWASNYTAKGLEEDSVKSGATADWMTWWEAAALWRIPENMPDRQALAQERCEQYPSRSHIDPIWAAKGILQYDMTIDALMTTTNTDTNTRTLESYGDLKGSKSKALGDLVPDIRIHNAEWRALQELEKVCTNGSTKLNSNMPAVKQNVAMCKLEGEVHDLLAHVITTAALLVDNICEFGASCQAFGLLFMYLCVFVLFVSRLCTMMTWLA